MRTCTLDGCDRPYKANGYCNLHRQRLAKYGDPLVTHTPTLGTDDVTYAAAHLRVQNAKGRASQHKCDGCGGQAQEWAYDGTDPHERHHPKGYAYSVHPWHYQPMCCRCHRRFDAQRRRLRQTHGGEGERSAERALGRGLHAITCTPQLTT